MDHSDLRVGPRAGADHRESSPALDPERSPLDGLDPAPGGFAATLDEAIRRRGLGLERIRYHLRQRGHDLSIGALSYWRTGRSRPERPASLAAVGALEEILGVPRGALARHLVGESPQHPPYAHSRPVVHEVLTLDADWRPLRHRFRELCEIHQPGVASLALTYPLPGGAEAVRVRAEGGVRVGRCRVTPARVAAELVFLAPTHPGQLVLVEYEVLVTGAARRVERWQRACPTGARELYAEVRVAGGAPPAQVSAFLMGSGHRRTWPVDAEAGVWRLHLADVGPGVCGLRWRD